MTDDTDLAFFGYYQHRGGFRDEAELQAYWGFLVKSRLLKALRKRMGHRRSTIYARLRQTVFAAGVGGFPAEDGERPAQWSRAPHGKPCAEVDKQTEAQRMWIQNWSTTDFVKVCIVCACLVIVLMSSGCIGVCVGAHDCGGLPCAS